MDEAYARRIKQEQEERMAWNADARARYQRVLDQWVQSQRDLAEEERRMMRALDPFGWGHWN
jgi:hypothetical protein